MKIKKEDENQGKKTNGKGKTRFVGGQITVRGQGDVQMHPSLVMPPVKAIVHVNIPQVSGGGCRLEMLW